MTKPMFSELYDTKAEANAAARRLERQGYKVTVLRERPAGQKYDGWLVKAY